MDDLEQVWKRQHAGAPPPWSGAPRAAQGQLGDWVLEQARAARFNLIEAARELGRRKRAGRRVPLCGTRSELVPRVSARVRKVCDVLRDSKDGPVALRRRFGKLPAGYEEVLERAHRAVTGR